MKLVESSGCPALDCPESQQITLSRSCCKVCKGKAFSEVRLVCGHAFTLGQGTQIRLNKWLPQASDTTRNPAEVCMQQIIVRLLTELNQSLGILVPLLDRPVCCSGCWGVTLQRAGG